MKTQSIRSSKSAAVPEIVEAWELYAGASYEELCDRFADSDLPEIADLRHLSRLSLAAQDETSANAIATEETVNARAMDDAAHGAARGQAGTNEAAHEKSLFAPLRRGMDRYYDADREEAALILGEWLLQRDYYCEVVLSAFIDSARYASEYGLLGRVCKRFVDRPAYVKYVAEPLFLSVYHADRPKEAVLIFEKFREHFDDAVVLQKVALAMLRLGRFQDAERLLMPVYAKLTGRGYDPTRRYEDIQAEYAPAIRNKAKLAAMKDRSFEESMELGMAYLFSGEYDQALHVLQSLQKSRAA